MRGQFFALIALSLLLNVPVWAETIFGRVVGIADGDTITLLTPDKTRIKERP